jgi:hypothetical protein
MTSNQAWTRAEDVETLVLKLWLQGRILAAKVTGKAIFPRRIPMRGPDSAEFATRFAEAQIWIRALEAASRTGRGFGFDLIWREVRHPQLGRNRVPCGLEIPTEGDALELIGKCADAERFDALTSATATAFPELLSWLARKPLLALEHVADWPRILAVLAWFKRNPNSGLYLRQVDIAQVDTKFIESRRGLLTELLDVVLSPTLIETATGAAATFEARYGLRSKPALVRFRLLDNQPTFGGLSDISTPAEAFTRLDLTPRVVFITENDVNGLAFPPVTGALVVFGLGYGVDLLAKADWLGRSRIVYWGDIDTHGFAVLARLRAYFPKVQSLLMDEATLLAHQSSWVREERPFVGELSLLSEAESRLFGDLKLNRFGVKVRLEQERIAFAHLTNALHSLDF